MAKDEGQNQLRGLSEFDDISNLYAVIVPKLGVQRNILKLQKNTAAARALPGMIAPSVFFYFYFFCVFTSLVLPPSPSPPCMCMAACQMWRKPYLDLMILQKPFYTNSNSVLIDTQLSASLSWYKWTCLSFSIESSISVGDEACLLHLIICLVGKPPRLIRYHL